MLMPIRGHGEHCRLARAAPLFGRDPMAGPPNKCGVLVISNQTLVTHRIELVQHLTTSQPTGSA